jgi:hypothetical protein
VPLLGPVRPAISGCMGARLHHGATIPLSLAISGSSTMAMDLDKPPRSVRSEAGRNPLWQQRNTRRKKRVT